MKNIISILIIIQMSACAIYADGDSGYAGAYLRNGAGARALGMGGAFTAISEGADATYFNPAGMGFNTKLSIALSYKTMTIDRHLGHFAVAFPIRNEAVMAASWVNAGVSDVPNIGSSQQFDGTVKNNANAFALSFAKAIDNTVSIGGNLRYTQEKLSTLDAFAIGMDLGLLYRPHKLVTTGLVVQNIGSNLRWDSGKYWADGDSYDDNVPIVIKFGIAGNIMDGVLLPAIDFEKSDKMGLRFRAGAEYWFVKKITVKVEDEYEEGQFIDEVHNIRWAGLRIGLDRGAPTFGASYAYPLGSTSVAIEYAYLVGREGLASDHLFTFKIGL